MTIGRKRIGLSIVAFWLAAGLSAFGIVPYAERPGSVSEAAAQSITIRAPASVASGAQLCFEVVCYAGIGSVTVEINDVMLPVSQSPSNDPSVLIFCVKIPAGCTGSTVTITAVSSSGQVATATVAVT